MEKLRNWVMLILMIVVYGCSSDDSFIEELESYESRSRSVAFDSDEILNSLEFRSLDESYTELVSIVRNSIGNLTQDEINEFSELHLLYKDDSLKYESLYEHFVCNILFKDNYENVGRIYKSFSDARKEFLLKEQYKVYLENDGGFIASMLMQNAGQVTAQRVLIKSTKTRGEENVQKCLDLCKEQYDSDINYAFLIMGCATAFNIGACVLGLGLSVPAAAWTQASILALYEIEVRKAEDDYELCKKGCYI